MLIGDSPKAMFTNTAAAGCVMMVVVGGCTPGGAW